MTDTPTHVIERDFNAPRDLVWQAFTDPDMIVKWYGPGGVNTAHEFDLRPGGLWRGEMRYGDNSMYFKCEFTDVNPKDMLAWLQSQTDKDWNPVSNPMMPDWPKVMRTDVEFTDNGETTHITLTWTPQNASPAELAAFEAAAPNMGNGWGKGFEVLDSIFESQLS